MGQEFFINSEELENKIRQLLPSQGGAGAGFDLSASTQIIPVIDLTESAEGSNLRQDLQRASSHGSITNFDVSNATSTVLSNTGYYNFQGVCFGTATSSGDKIGSIFINDGSTSRFIRQFTIEDRSVTDPQINVIYEFDTFLNAGDSIIVTSNNTDISINGFFRQIATIDGVLVNPS